MRFPGTLTLHSRGRPPGGLSSIRKAYRQGVDDHVKDGVVGEYPATSAAQRERVGSSVQSVAGKNNPHEGVGILIPAWFGNCISLGRQLSSSVANLVDLERYHRIEFRNPHFAVPSARTPNEGTTVTPNPASARPICGANRN